MTDEHVPANIDHLNLIRDLNGWGLNDYKIKLILGFSEGYVAQLKCGNIAQMSYQKAARLYNFWVDERNNHVRRLQIQTEAQTT